MKKRTLFSFLSAAAAIIAAGRFFPREAASPSEPEPAKVPAASAAQRIDYFASHGWEVEEIAGRDVSIPAEFSPAYEEYVRTQDAQGLPLRRYAGRNGRLYVYEVKNYSPGNKKMLAELLVCDEAAVASLVYSEDGGSLRSSVS